MGKGQEKTGDGGAPVSSFPFPLSDSELRRLAEAALAEDRADEDVTTAALVPDDQRGRTVVVAKAEGVLAGLAIARAVFLVADASLEWQAHREDGDRVSPGDRVATVEGPLAAVLRGERSALNYLTHLSGVATATAAFVRELESAGGGCRLRDTRKTLPGLRGLEKYAVRCGGGTNHRADLASGVLVKDNHLSALRARGLGIADAVRMARETLARASKPGLTVEIEVTSVEEAREALEAGADELLLDNMSPEVMREVVRLAAGYEPRPLLEASGGITLENARAIAETGVDFVSVGALTHSAKALDMSLEVEGA